MATVFRGRAVSKPDILHDLVFMHDRGGQGRFRDLPNVQLRIVRKGRLEGMVRFAARQHEYSDVSVTSLPTVANELARDGQRVHYEFHSSTLQVIRDELGILDLAKVATLRVPSRYMSQIVAQELPMEMASMVEVVPNVVDRSVFSVCGPTSDSICRKFGRPIVWIGRFDKGKNPNDLIRALSLMPDDFWAVVIVSMESDPGRMADFLATLSQYGLQDRARVFLNLEQGKIAQIYRAAAQSGGVFCSTSLAESFGYGVAEALACGLPVAAYDVGALGELGAVDRQLLLIPPGDVRQLARAIEELSGAHGPDVA